MGSRSTWTYYYSLKSSSGQINLSMQVIYQLCHDIRISIQFKFITYKLVNIIRKMSSHDYANLIYIKQIKANPKLKKT